MLNWFILNYIPKSILIFLWKFFIKKQNNKLLYLIHVKDMFQLFKKLYKEKNKQQNKYYQITIKDCFKISEMCSNISLALAHNVYLFFICHLKLCTEKELIQHLTLDDEKLYCSLFFTEDIEKISKNVVAKCTITFIYNYLLVKSYRSMIYVAMELQKYKEHKETYKQLLTYQSELKQQYNYILSILYQNSQTGGL